MIVISGYGRAGTSLLVAILTELGFDTSFSKETYKTELTDTKQHSGFETWFSGIHGEVLKQPWGNLPLDSPSTPPLDFVIIPIRGAELSAKSRMANGPKKRAGLEGSCTTVEQQVELSQKHLGALVDYVVMNDIPFAFLKFPQYITNPRYVCRQLKPILKPRGITYEQVKNALEKIADENLVHYKKAFSMSPPR